MTVCIDRSKSNAVWANIPTDNPINNPPRTFRLKYEQKTARSSEDWNTGVSRTFTSASSSTPRRTDAAEPANAYRHRDANNGVWVSADWGVCAELSAEAAEDA